MQGAGSYRRGGFGPSTLSHVERHRSQRVLALCTLIRVGKCNSTFRGESWTSWGAFVQHASTAWLRNSVAAALLPWSASPGVYNLARPHAPFADPDCPFVHPVEPASLACAEPYTPAAYVERRWALLPTQQPLTLGSGLALFAFLD